MKLNYYGYYISDHRNSSDALFDLRPFVSAFCELDDIAFKNTFTYNGENIYLFHSRGPVFLLVMTRNQEIIKTINANELSLGELHDTLAREESLGFASYIYLGDKYFGLASTLMAPRVKAFSCFMTDLMDKVGLDNYSFHTRALLYQADREEVFRLPLLGRASIEVEKGTGTWDRVFGGTFGGSGEGHLQDVGSIEVTIKPKPRQDIKDAVRQFADQIEDDDLKKFVVKAKADLEDQLTDLYIVGRGAISDIIDKGPEHEVRERILEVVDENEALREKVAEFKRDAGFEEDFDGSDFDRLDRPAAWADTVRRLYGRD